MQLAGDINALIWSAGGSVAAVAKLPNGALHHMGAVKSWREARRLVKTRGMRLEGDGRPQLIELHGADVLQVRCRWGRQVG